MEDDGFWKRDRLSGLTSPKEDKNFVSSVNENFENED